MIKTNTQETDDIIEDINEETLLSLDENLEQDQETSEIAEGNCEGSKEDESMEEEMTEATTSTTLDDFASEGEIIATLKKIAGVRDHLKKIKASIYFDDTDFVVGDKTAVRDALFNNKLKISDLAKAILQSKGNQKEDASMEEAEVSSDKEFMEYAKGVLKAAHGDKYDEDKATKTAEGILKKADGDYGAAIGMLTSGLGEEMEDDEMADMKETAEYKIDTSDISRLIESEEGLTEEFKEKATTIFEAAVKSKLKEAEETLKESYAVTLIEEVETIKEELVDKIDNYLTYAVESWVEDNKVAVESSLRTQIAENFMQSLKTVFEENYIEVPESKVDLYAKLEGEKEAAESKLAESLNLLSGLIEKVESSSREKIIAESTSDLALTQAEKLKELLEDIEFTNETAFRKKVQTIKEFYIKKQTSDDSQSLSESAVNAEDSYITTSTIVENETETQQNVSPAMQKYLTAISRLNKANTANIQ